MKVKRIIACIISIIMCMCMISPVSVTCDSNEYLYEFDKYFPEGLHLRSDSNDVDIWRSFSHYEETIYKLEEMYTGEEENKIYYEIPFNITFIELGIKPDDFEPFGGLYYEPYNYYELCRVAESGTLDSFNEHFSCTINLVPYQVPVTDNNGNWKICYDTEKETYTPYNFSISKLMSTENMLNNSGCRKKHVSAIAYENNNNSQFVVNAYTYSVGSFCMLGYSNPSMVFVPSRNMDISDFVNILLDGTENSHLLYHKYGSSGQLCFDDNCNTNVCKYTDNFYCDYSLSEYGNPLSTYVSMPDNTVSSYMSWWWESHGSGSCERVDSLDPDKFYGNVYENDQAVYSNSFFVKEPYEFSDGSVQLLDTQYIINFHWDGTVTIRTGNIANFNSTRHPVSSFLINNKSVYMDNSSKTFILNKYRNTEYDSKTKKNTSKIYLKYDSDKERLCTISGTSVTYLTDDQIDYIVNIGHEYNQIVPDASYHVHLYHPTQMRTHVERIASDQKDDSIEYDENARLLQKIKELEAENATLRQENTELKNRIHLLSTGTYGDVNGDNTVDIQDAQIILAYYTQKDVALMDVPDLVTFGLNFGKE